MPRFARGDEVVDVTEREQQRELYRDGWQRIRHDEAAFDDTEPRAPELDRALHEDPDDQPSLAVLADLLLQANHPRGQLISLALQPPTPERATEARHLRRAARDVLVGPLRTRIGLDWEGGFIRRARIRVLEDLEGALFDVLRHPSARLLRELQIELPPIPHLDLRLLIDTLVHHQPAPPLRVIDLNSGRRVEEEPSLGSITALSRAHPRLERIRLEGIPEETAGFAFPHARQFTLTTQHMSRRTLADIVAAPWPRLELLRLWFGMTSECTIGDLAPLFDSLPRLTYLSILDTGYASDIIRELARRPIAKQLQDLDFGEDVDDDAAALVTPAMFPRLRYD